MNEDSGIYAIFQTLMAFFQGPAFAVLLIGILWRRATGRAAFIALLCGIATSVSLYAMNQPAVLGAMGWEPLFRIQEPFLYFSIWAFVVTAVLLIGLSLLGSPDSEDKLRYVLGGSTRPPATALSETADSSSDGAES